MGHGRRPRYGNPDRVQPEIIAAAESLGIPHDQIRVTTGVGRGFPDLCLPWRGMSVLVEVEKKKGKRRNPEQERFRATWTGGPVLVANTGPQLIHALLKLDRETPPAAPGRPRVPPGQYRVSTTEF